jgi:acetyltransferase-like isoleucine patch superfamily enzyme
MIESENRFIRQWKLCVIFAFNALYNLVPFFFLKNILLRLTGIAIGSGAVIHTPARFLGMGRINIGANTVVNRGCYLDNRVGIKIGSNVSIAHDTKIYTLGHDIDDPYFSLRGAKVEIGDYVCIFSNVLIMPGVKLGKGAVVYAGSVVTKDVGEYEVVGGNPARLIRHRSKDLRYTVKHDYWFAF